MKTEQQTIAYEISWSLGAWLPRAAAVLVAWAILFALPIGTAMAALLVSAVGIGIGVAELRRHGGPDVPALPFTAED